VELLVFCVTRMAESQVSIAEQVLREFFDSTANLPWREYTVLGSKEEDGSLTKFLDVELDELRKLFLRLEYVYAPGFRKAKS
jgi:hypothetical protein